MKAIMVMFDSLNRRFLSCYGCGDIKTPNFDRLAQHAVTFDQCYIGSMPCMPARRELHTGRYNFFHRSWGPLEPFDDSMPEMLKKNGIYTHLVSDHQHYWEDGGATYHSRYSSWQANRGQEGDPWIGQVRDPEGLNLDSQANAMRKRMLAMGYPDMKKNDVMNRAYAAAEEDMPQAQTFRAGLDFIKRNHESDGWFLQIETFDPHEPFFASERYKAMYPDPDGYNGPDFDWPAYQRVKEPEDEKQHCINRYKALVSQCDASLGKVLDAMDRYGLWKDTMLIVNTDHGFLLGEHDWWGKSAMPHYNEVAHIPLFVWNPRIGKQGERRQSLVQTIDLAPTLLTWFGIPVPPDMAGHDLTQTLWDDTPVREWALFGTHAEYINMTDGRYVYMRRPRTNVPQFEYTLMPTHMRLRFTPEELRGMTLTGPFSFTKGIPVLKIPCSPSSTINLEAFDTALYDTETDPHQENPLDLPEKELQLINTLRNLMLANDAPSDAFAAMGLSQKTDYTLAQLLEEKEVSRHPVLQGFEEYQLTKEAYLQLKAMFRMMPADRAESMRMGMKKMFGAMQLTEIRSEHIVRFIESLPMPDEQKKLALSFIQL